MPIAKSSRLQTTMLRSTAILILLLYFREPLSAMLQITSFSKYFIFSFPFLCLLQSEYSSFKQKVFTKNPVLFTSAGILTLSIGYFVYLYFNKNISAALLSNFAQDIFLYQIVTILVFLTRFKTSKILYFFEKYSIILILLFSTYILFEVKILFGLNLLSIEEYRDWLKGSAIHKNHIPGFLNTLQTSTMILSSFTIYYFSNKLLREKNGNEWKKLFFPYLVILLVHYTVSVTYSVSNMGIILGSSCALIGIWGYKNNKIFISFLLMSPLFFIFYQSDTFGKLLRYLGNTEYLNGITYRQMIFESFVPTLENCNIKLYAGQNISEVCSNNELHLFSGTKNLGLFPDLPRLLLLFSPILCSFIVLKRRYVELYPLTAFSLVLLFGSFHYPTLTIWPNIFVFQIAVKVLLENSFVKN